MDDKVWAIKNAANKVALALLQEGLTVQRYDAYSTNSVYLKVDYGVCNSIRISDHPGKKHLNYRFNLLTEVDHDYTDTSGKYERKYYTLASMGKLIADVAENKAQKIKQYGTQAYQTFMKKNQNEHDNDGGFWEQARLLELNSDGDVVTASKKSNKNNKAMGSKVSKVKTNTCNVTKKNKTDTIQWARLGK